MSLKLGPLGFRTYSGKYGWGVSAWAGSLFVDLSWDR